MTPIVLTSKVGPDGVLHLTLPLTAADQDVRVTVEPIAPKKDMTPEEWRAFILSTAGELARRIRATRTGRIGRARAVVVSHLLDTNAFVDHLRRGPASKVTAKLLAAPSGSIYLCSVVLGELIFGAVRSGAAHEAANRALIAGLRVRLKTASEGSNNA
jgi:PIN domain